MSARGKDYGTLNTTGNRGVGTSKKPTRKGGTGFFNLGGKKVRLNEKVLQDARGGEGQGPK